MCKIWGLSMCRAGREIMFPCIEIALLLFLKKSFRFFPVPNQDISMNRIAVRKKKTTLNQNFVRSSN